MTKQTTIVVIGALRVKKCYQSYICTHVVHVYKEAHAQFKCMNFIIIIVGLLSLTV